MTLWLQAVIPCSPRIFYLMEKFPRVVSLDFSRCPKLRNRHLHRLLSYNVPLEELQIGHSVGGLYKHPRITNEVCFLASDHESSWTACIGCT